jgi:hypothetical protein
VINEPAAWADALDAEMDRAEDGPDDLVIRARDAGEVCGVAIDPGHPESDGERWVLVSKHGWIVRYVPGNRWWVAD